jgi:adenylyl-sulfate kinase
MTREDPLAWQAPAVDRSEIERRLGQRGGVVWLTGLSAAGKSTVAHRVQRVLFQAGHLAVVLDGDNVRHGLCGDLGFSRSDRSENLRRVSHVARLFADFGLLVLVALISPYREDRQRAREICAPDFYEVFIKTSLEQCERRDPKGLYRKARAGVISDFTGISAPYEPPLEADLTIDCESASPEDSARVLLDFLRKIELAPGDVARGPVGSAL